MGSGASPERMIGWSQTKRQQQTSKEAGRRKEERKTEMPSRGGREREREISQYRRQLDPRNAEHVQKSTRSDGDGQVM